jgi:hypothetical protein
MIRFAFLALTILTVQLASAQVDTMPQMPTPVPVKAIHPPRSADHFMIQFGYTSWTNKPDSIHTTGFPRTANVYLMLDFPFKTNPHLSVAIGPGVSADNIYFEKTYIGLKDATPTVRFTNLSDTNYFKKYKMATAFLEAPVELRWRSNPGDDKRSAKVALGAKVGTLLSAMVKGKDLANRSGNVLLPYTSKEKSKQFLNKTRISVMGRVGYGNFTAFVSYAITPVFREGAGPQVRPLTIGLTLSGL